MGAAGYVEHYDLALLGLALPQIQAGLGIAEPDVGTLTAVVRIGVMPALLRTVLADRIGRRRLLLTTIVGVTLCTFLTAFVRTAAEFAALQFLARMFIAGELMLAVVVIVEEFDADSRGWGIGMMAALAACGGGFAAIVFSVVNVLPFGWRALYVVGIVPLVLVAWFRRALSETRRFERHRHTRTPEFGLRAAVQPFVNLVRMYPGRLVALCAALLPIAFVFDTSMVFVSKFLQEAHRYSPANVAMMYLTIGASVPIANVVAGRLGDRFGRKRVMVAGVLGYIAGVAGFYHVVGAWVPLAWALMVMTLTLVNVLFATLGGELFPTSYRSTASGARGVIATLGAALGLWTEGRLYGVVGSHVAAITLMLVVVPLAPLIIALTLPETAARELEDIAPERLR
jgi:MFS family permease